MKKLNEKGWGLTTLLVFICVFILILVGVAILSYHYGANEGRKNNVNKRERNIIVAP